MKNINFGFIGGSVALLAALFVFVMINLAGFGASDPKFVSDFFYEFWFSLGIVAILSMVGMLLALFVRKRTTVLILVGLCLVAFSVYEYFKVGNFVQLYPMDARGEYQVYFVIQERKVILRVFDSALYGAIIGGGLLILEGLRNRTSKFIV